MRAELIELLQKLSLVDADLDGFLDPNAEDSPTETKTERIHRLKKERQNLLEQFKKLGGPVLTLSISGVSKKHSHFKIDDTLKANFPSEEFLANSEAGSFLCLTTEGYLEPITEFLRKTYDDLEFSVQTLDADEWLLSIAYASTRLN